MGGGERAPAFAATADKKDKAAVPALARDRSLQGAPRPSILREQLLRAALLDVDHQKDSEPVGVL